jgi:sugar transferase (PEP-CTERM system associated)
MMQPEILHMQAPRKLLVLAPALAAGIVLILWHLEGGAKIGGLVASGLVLSGLWYMLILSRASTQRRRRASPEVLILGKSGLAETLRRELSSSAGASGSRFFSKPSPIASSGSPDWEEPDALKELIFREGISRVVIAEPDLQTREDLASVLVECKLRGVRIQDAPDFYEGVMRKMWLEALWPGWFMFSEGFQLSRRDRFFKRTFDIVCSLALAIITLPLMGIIAVAIKFDSSGPVLFRQKRVGQGNRTFTLFKFRSMREDAESETGPVWASAEDDRVTSLGRFLRQTHLDELPQIFNVLRNDLSFVGPRPERPVFVRRLAKQIPFYQLRHHLKPGITGWAQVKLAYGDSVEAAHEKLQYDLYYAKHASLSFDLKILLLTVVHVLSRGGR